MTDTKPPACYREPTNGVRFIREAHTPDCGDGACKGCRKCPERHCTARKNCTWHVAAGEQTCGRCLSAVRLDLRWISALAPLLPTQAIADGAESQAASLAASGADYATFSARRRLDKRWIEEHLPPSSWERAWKGLLDDDDEHHPYSVTTRWEAMIREDYGHEPPTDTVVMPDGSKRQVARPTSIAGAVAYLDRTLHRIAHDDEQDFPLMRRELRKCRQHLEAVLHNDDRPDRGIPCPECASERTIEVEAADREGREVEKGKKSLPRLARVYGHWCDDDDCERLHYDDESDDVWRCPRNRQHEWTHKAYTDRLAERRVTA